MVGSFSRRRRTPYKKPDWLYYIPRRMLEQAQPIKFSRRGIKGRPLEAERIFLIREDAKGRQETIGEFWHPSLLEPVVRGAKRKDRRFITLKTMGRLNLGFDRMKRRATITMFGGLHPTWQPLPYEEWADVLLAYAYAYYHVSRGGPSGPPSIIRCKKKRVIRLARWFIHRMAKP